MVATATLYPSSSSFTHRLSHRPIPSPPFPPPSLRRETLFVLHYAPTGTGRRFAVAPGPPSPPGPEPPPPRRDTNELAGLARAMSRIQDRVKIFFAVLFWMSLFFWASASDGKGKGKRKKGSRFK